MIKKSVKDVMISVNDYAKVKENDSLLDAIIALKKSQEKVPKNLHPFRAVLIVNKKNEIVGKLGHLALLKALEPKYDRSKDMNKLSQANLSSDFIDSMMGHFSLWDDDFFDACTRAKSINVKEVMKTVDERIDENETLLRAMHKIIMWQSLSLLVAKGNDITGIIRLSDIYNEVETYITEKCKVE